MSHLPPAFTPPVSLPAPAHCARPGLAASLVPRVQADAGRRAPSFLRAALLFLPLVLCLSACGNDANKAESQRLAPVRLAKAVTRDIPRVVEAVGNVEAFTSVAVKPQVGGQILEMPVAPGQEVKKGDILFRLDPRPFDAVVAEAEARLVRDKALLDKARKDLARYTTLLKEDVISREAYDQMATAAQMAQAGIQEDEAALQAAKLNREYSVIRAPVAGRLGNIFIRLGNVIKANDDRTLVVINSIRPAEVQFTVAERYLPAILQRMKAGPLAVSVLPAGDTGAPISGTVSAVNNEVDRNTGSIRLHALFDNEDNRLWPGQFVRVTLVMDTVRGAVLIPERAVQEGLSGQYIYIAVPEEGNYRVNPRPVKTDKGPEGFAAVISGVQPEDLVVTDGQLGLAPGALARAIEAPE